MVLKINIGIAMAITPVPSLSVRGWIVAIPEKADLLFSHFFESDGYQSYIYGSNVSNLQNLVRLYGHAPELLCENIRNTLFTYLGRYYPSVNVDVTFDTSVDNKISVTIFIDVVEENRKYQFSRLLMVTNSKIEKVIKLNNDGYL